MLPKTLDLVKKVFNFELQFKGMKFIMREGMTVVVGGGSGSER